MNGRILCYTLLVVALSLTSPYNCLPNYQRLARDVGNQKNMVGVATNIIAANILKGNSENNNNFVFSPLGYSSILAILNEGARGETNTDIASLLKHPEEKLRVRLAYQDVLKNLQGDNPLMAPQFKTWLYIYRNNTVDEDFKTRLMDNYFVDVKDIDRLEDSGDWVEEDKAPAAEESIDVMPEHSISEINIDTAKKPGETENSKDIPDFETLKSTNPVAEDETRLIDDQKDSSKFDEVVEDKQYVEVPVIKEEISKEKLVELVKEKIVSDNNQYLKDAVDLKESLKSIKEEIKGSNQIQINLKDDDSLEIMDAQETQFRRGRDFSLRNSGDVASVISGNSLVGKKSNTKDGDIDSTESKLILFNGLYYRGSWAIPFQQLRTETDNVFYTSETQKVPAKMMRARGFYRIASIKDLKAQAIEMPYDNERYTLLIVLPNTRNGLKSLLAEFKPDTLSEIVEQLQEESIDLCVPKFSIDTTSGAEKILAKAGLASIFTSKADFSGIIADQKIHVDELQQHVSVRVDEGASSENFLTSTNALRSNAQPEQSIAVDRPFLFFVRDVVDDVIIVAGKITEPPANDEPSI